MLNMASAEANFGNMNSALVWNWITDNVRAAVSKLASADLCLHAATNNLYCWAHNIVVTDPNSQSREFESWRGSS